MDATVPVTTLLEYALKLLGISQEELVNSYLDDRVEIVEENLLNADTQLIAHQCNCVSRSAKGLAKEIFDRWPKANVYKNRSDVSKPGTISVKPIGNKQFVCNMFAQFNTGAPDMSSLDDTSTQRCIWFNQCLTAISKLKNIKSIAFPYGIGCGLAAGKKEGIDEGLWRQYFRMIKLFAYNNPNIKVKVYRKGRKVTKEEEVMVQHLNKCLSNSTTVDIYPRLEGMTCEEFEEVLQHYIKNDGRPIFYEHFKEDHIYSDLNGDDALEKEEDVYSIAISTNGNNPFNDDCTYENTDLLTYTYQEAIKVPNFEGWLPFFELAREDIERISEELVGERGTTIYPPLNNLYTAFNLCPFNEVKVVILGQDPYPHNPGEAMGLCFSVPEGIKIPSSLRNIFIELKSDGFRASKSGDLSRWAKQGVLMINTTLTVRAKEPGSHLKLKMWNSFTEKLLKYIDYNHKNLVFLMWGKPAQFHTKYLSLSKQFIVESSHPSGLSAYNGDKPFIGSKPFSRANALLKKVGKKEIDWNLS